MKLFFDTETTDMINWGKPYNDPSQPVPVSIAMVITDDDCNIINEIYTLIDVGIASKEGAFSHHKITRNMTDKFGIAKHHAIEMFEHLYKRADEIVGHNVKFDMGIMNCFGSHFSIPVFTGKPTFCTMLESTKACAIPSPKGFKWPKLSEALKILCGEELIGAHNALVDVKACVKIYKKLKGPQSSGIERLLYEPS